MDEYFLEPPSYDRTLRQCSRIKLQNPEIKLFPIGKSFLGRKIYALAIGNTKNAVLFAGAFHAQEWLTCSLLMRFSRNWQEHIPKTVCCWKSIFEIHCGKKD